MRIIAGKYKGRKLASLKGDATRPTLDRVRENLFNILSGRVCGAKVLDLFSGTGAIGVEALSRGASDVVFCDQSRDAVGVIRTNLKTVGENRRVVCADYKQCLRALGDEQFDLIYLDPPYGFEPDLAAISAHLSTGGLIIFENSSEMDLNLPEKGFIIKDERKYGVAKLTILETENV